MGWDIHSVTQILTAGKWVTVEHGTADGNRDYDLFGLLAGVRDYPHPIAPPRGFPEDFETAGTPGFITH